MLVAAAITVLEIDRLIAGSLSKEGESSPLGSVIGPFAFAGRDAWDRWASNTAAGGSIPWWIVASVLVDIVIVVCYFWAFSRVIQRMTAKRKAAGRWTLRVLVAIEIVEGLLLSAGAILLGLRGDPSRLAESEWFGIAIASFATAKWVALVTLAVLVLRDHVENNPRAGSRGYLAELSIRLGQALWVHRLSSFLIVVLFVFACIPSDGVLDQLPDVQRQWVGLGWVGAGHAAAAGLAVFLASFCALVLGRARTRALVSAAQGYDEYKVKTTWKAALWWLVPLGAWFLLYLITRQATDFRVAARIAWVFVAIPIAVLVSYLFSIWVKALRRGRVARRRDYRARARFAWLAGDATAVAIIGIGGLGLIRSFTAPVLAGNDISSGDEYGWSVVLLLAGVAVVFFSPVMMEWKVEGRRAGRAVEAADPDRISNRELLDPTRRIDRDVDQRFAARHRGVTFLFFIAGVTTLAYIAYLPIQVATLLGASAVTVLALTAWGAVLGAFTVGVQARKPAPIFRLLRLRATPVLTLAVVIPLIASVIFAFADWDDPNLHATRIAATNGTSAPEDQADLSGQTGIEATTEPTAGGDGGESADVEAKFSDLIDARLDGLAKESCLAEAGDRTFVPAVVVVAEGGGIRAAYWTARALEELRRNGGCLADSILLSSGVSGGSVGLAATAVSTNPTKADTNLKKLAGPATVGTGVAGLLVGDLVASSTGVPFPSYWNEERKWRDRAALIEHVWIDAIDGLDRGVALAADDRIGIPVLNSTDARSKCKLLVADGVAGGGDLSCVASAMSPAATLPMQAECFDGLDWATSAMLSARFPIITPAARFDEGDGCGDEDMQLIDGGYAEGSGLGTAADLAPGIADAISEWNAREYREHPIVPILLFLKNSAGYDLREDLDAVAAEPLVPIIGFSAASKQATQAAWIQRIASAFGTVGTATDAAGDAITGLREKLPALTVVVAPSTEPAVVPPLGWSLSDFSIGSLNRAMDRQLQPAQGVDVPTLHTLNSLAKKQARDGDGDGVEVAEAGSGG